MSFKGLSDVEVSDRILKKQFNYNTTIRTKSYFQIFKSNICTLFNFINVFLGILILLVGSYKNLLFLGTVFCNIFIGIFQEIRSKKIIDKLSLVSETKATVIRNFNKCEISIQDIVLDDIIVYESGNQVSVDTEILDGFVQINEALITGEMDPVNKIKGDILLSGSYVVSGDCIGKVIHVGCDNYTYKITKDAKVIKPVTSEIMRSMKKIIKVVSIVIVPLGIIFFLKQLYLSNVSSAVVNTAAALISVIPDGLMLLTSTVMAISVIKLSKHNVLAQDLYCIENLARVDTICFDKTGTLTKGIMHVNDVIMFNNISDSVIRNINGCLDNHNLTMAALIEKYGKNDRCHFKKVVPFSSEKKWSGVTFSNDETYILGAPDYMFKKMPLKLFYEYNKYVNDYRLIVLASSKSSLLDDQLPNDLEVCALFLMDDEIRCEASNMIQFLEENDVSIKIISGDNPKTVSRIASRLNLSFKDKYIDVSGLSDDELRLAVNKYSIFGRVTPQGKKVIVEALQSSRHVVSVVGDGVNDVLALRQSDCGISLASGVDATRNVSELVLLDSNFNSILEVIKEGRQVINNVERSAGLFITKTIYSALLLSLFLLVSIKYLFIPIHLTLVSVFTIGIPAFILSLEPNDDKVKGKFIYNVIKTSFPASITIFIDIIVLLILSCFISTFDSYLSTIGVLILTTVGFMNLYYISKPLNLLRIILLVFMIISVLIAIFGFNGLFSLSVLNYKISIIYVILFIFSYFLFNLMIKLFSLLFGGWEK